jgi:hypothetical protein
MMHFFDKKMKNAIIPKAYLRMLFIGLSFLISGFAAQAQIVTGAVTDSESNEGIPGVSVTIKGTTSGTITDIDGKFTINASGEDILSISYVGFINQEISVGNQSVINMALEPDIQQLEEIIVTGYTSEKRGDIIGSVSVVDSDDALSTPSNNLSQQLQGRAAGVTVSGDSRPQCY